ncbi:MAG: P83/100 family protein [Spirochaetota bacterium]
MKKISLIALLVLTSAISSWSMEVDIDEILKSDRVNFTNYSGRQRGTDSVQDIRNIGTGLARGAGTTGYNKLFRYHMKYSILRAMSDDDKEKYSADIFFIDQDAKVDHIKNVRRIISSYLVSMYSYSIREADTLALFLSYYNAIYRGDMDYISKTYNEAVTKHVNSSNAGLSTNFQEWPGKTAMLIPLTADSKRDKLKGIDPFIIADKKTLEEVKKEKDNLDARKDIIELKQKNIEDEKTRIEADKKQIEEDKALQQEKEKQLRDEQKKTEEAKKALEKEQEQLEKEKAEAEKIQDPIKKEEEKKKIAEKEDELKKKTDALKKQEAQQEEEMESLQDDKSSIEKKEESLKEKEKAVAEKEETLKEEKKELSEDLKKEKEETKKLTSDEIEKKEEALKQKEEELDKREDQLRSDTAEKNVFALKIFYLKIKDYLADGHYNNEMFMINPETKAVEFKSDVTNICGRRYDIFSGGIVVITHKGSHQKEHNLTLIDRNTLELTKTGTDDIFWRSFIEIRDQNIYAITKKGGKYFLGKFNTDLKLEAESSEEVSQDSFITFYEDSIYINRADKTIIILKKDDLSFIGEIKP